jgi:hypothetical protein
MVSQCRQTVHDHWRHKPERPVAPEDEAHGARFVRGTLARIDAVLRPRQKGKPPEYRPDFIASAVERELKRRERQQRKSS